MTETFKLNEALKPLAVLGYSNIRTAWTKKTPEWMKDIGPAQIPALIELIEQWPELFEDDQDEPWPWAPLYAWRALGYLKAVKAVEPILALLEKWDELEDDWYIEEIPKVFGMIGPDVIEPCFKYLANQSNKVIPRAVACDSLNAIAQRQPVTRQEVIEKINAVLADFEKNEKDLNGLIICNLLDLKAVESVDLIMRAFKAEQVDRMVVDETSIRDELHVSIGSKTEIKPGPRPGTILVDGEIMIRSSRKIYMPPTKKKKTKNSKKAKHKQGKISRKKNRKKK
ncbi:MAG: DUF1186 domain-containing protein [Deltaproteobacteria bacterium]|nr:DUF1186 domain-containing protein [Deltaproteobacteria bacterium]